VLATVLVLKHHNIAFLVAVEVTKNIVLVESTQASVWWNIDHRIVFLALLLEVLHHVLVHIDKTRVNIILALGQGLGLHLLKSRFLSFDRRLSFAALVLLLLRMK
jgi:hypothetical protein